MTAAMFASLLIAALAAAAPAAAWASQDLFGWAPCGLCLWQRWPYWAGAALALLAAAWPAGRRALLPLAGIAVLGSGAIAALHVGVEQGWWPSPLPSCAALRVDPGASVDELLRSLAPVPAKPCDAPTYPLPGLPLSLAGMNLIYALTLGAAALAMTRGLAWQR